MFTGMKKVYTKAVGGIYNRQLVQDDDLSDKSILLLFGTLSVSLQGGFSMRKQNIKTSEELDRLRLKDQSCTLYFASSISAIPGASGS